MSIQDLQVEVLSGVDVKEVSVVQTGPPGPEGPDGPPGLGIPQGGEAGQVLAKKTSADFDSEWVNPQQGGGGSHYLFERFLGRFNLNPDGRWIGFGATAGSNDPLWQGGGGGLEDPSINYQFFGPVFFENFKFKKIRGIVRSASGNSLPSVDFRFVFHVGEPGGWINNTAQFLEVGRIDAFELGGFGWHELNLSLQDFVAPSIGFFLVYVRPSVEVFGQQFLNASLTLEYEASGTN